MPSGPQYLAGGSLSFKTGSHAFLLAADRTIADPYGLGASSLFTTSAGWNWGRRGRGWRINASGGLQQIHQQTGAGSQNVSGWQGNVGFTQNLAKGMSLNLAYAYAQNSVPFVGLPVRQATHGVRVGLGWTP